MKDISLKLYVDYPHAIDHMRNDLYPGLWRNFLISVEYDPSLWVTRIDNILDIQYNAVRIRSGIRFKYEPDLLMFLLRFS